MKPMKLISVIQHTSADYLGLMEDHFEGRKIRFRYYRPFTEDGGMPAEGEMGDALILLGGGPWGTAGARNVPSLAAEIALARACYMNGKPVIGIGLGAQILALAADGSTAPTELAFTIEEATRVSDDALNGYLPATFPCPVYMRDRPVPPPFAKILAVNSRQEPMLFQIGENMFGFTGHPGFKRAMAEDLIMEFEESPADPGPTLATLGARKRDIEDTLVSIMTGLVQLTGLMRD